MMKSVLSLCLVLAVGNVFGQAQEEGKILALTRTVFQWEVAKQLDSLDKVFDEQYVLVGVRGEKQPRAMYLSELKSGTFEHKRIEPGEMSATVAGATAVVTGKALFTVSAAGATKTFNLSFVEVFTRPKLQVPWKVLGTYTSLIPN